MSTVYYNKNGDTVDIRTGFEDLITYEYKRDATTGALYYVVRIPQTDAKGNKQYPFVIWPNYPNGGKESPLRMNRRCRFLVAMNAGAVYEPYKYPQTGLPIGTVVENGVALRDPFKNYTQDSDITGSGRILTIDGNGKLDYVNLHVRAEEMANNGIVSAVYGGFPLIYNYNNFDELDQRIANFFNSDYANTNANAQKQMFCQYENGDYLILTAEGRGWGGGGYFTYRQMQTLARQYGVKFAWSCDGGGSASTIVGTKQLNNIYENTDGRPNACFLVFNGTTEFKRTNA